MKMISIIFWVIFFFISFTCKRQLRVGNIFFLKRQSKLPHLKFKASQRFRYYSLLLCYLIHSHDMTVRNMDIDRINLINIWCILAFWIFIEMNAVIKLFFIIIYFCCFCNLASVWYSGFVGYFWFYNKYLAIIITHWTAMLHHFNQIKEI